MINIRADVRYTREAVLKEIVKITCKGERVTQNDIAARLDMCRKTVYNHLQALTASGHIEITQTKPITYHVKNEACNRV